MLIKGLLIQLELNEIVRGTLIDTETFIADKKAQVKTTAETGPTLNNESVQRQKSKRIR